MNNKEKNIYLTVTAINKYISKKFEYDPYLNEIYVKGEVSNFKIHNNKNLYFSIKDANTKINVVKFGENNFLDISDGDNILVKAKVNFYFPRGEYNLLALDIKKDEVGNLHKKFLELKEKLFNEGIFDDKYKKNIPKFPKNIAVVTAKTGAAIQDITKTIYRRYPLASINLYSTLVQGEKSEFDIIDNLKKADIENNDVIILARGGGSIEDLWSFNLENVVKTIFNLKTPIITGIGHETDTTLCDFVADIRTSTPTAAAEIATPNIQDIKNYISINKTKLDNNISLKIKNYKQHLYNLKSNYYIKNYNEIYSNKREYLCSIQKNIDLIIKNKINLSKKDFVYYKKYISEIDLLKKNKEKFLNIISSLENNSPINILKKGYSFIYDNDRKKINSIRDVSIGSNINVKMQDGTLHCNVESIFKEEI